MNYTEVYNFISLGDYSSSIAQERYKAFIKKYGIDPLEALNEACEKANKYDQMIEKQKADQKIKEEILTIIEGEDYHFY